MMLITDIIPENGSSRPAMPSHRVTHERVGEPDIVGVFTSCPAFPPTPHPNGYRRDDTEDSAAAALMMADLPRYPSNYGDQPLGVDAF